LQPFFLKYPEAGLTY